MNLVKNSFVFTKTLCVLVGVLALTNTLALGQRTLDEKFVNKTQSSSEPIPAPNVIVAPNEEYRIGPGDLIEVRVEDAPELGVPNARVSPKGTFLMPFLQYIPAQGKTQDELSLLIAEKLRGRYLKNPQVTVLIKQPNSQTYIIQGAVRKPGVYQIEGRPSLMKLLGIAGGLVENHGSTAYVVRELKTPIKIESGEPANNQNSTKSANEVDDLIKYEMLSSNISSLYKGRFDQDVRLEPGDQINIPTADVFFVAGEVSLPGEFPLKDGTTLRQAIAMAQGTTIKADPKKAIIFREDEKGQRIEIPVDVDLITKGKKEDIKLMANDIVSVPNSKLKSALVPILNTIGSGASYAVGGRIIRR